MSDDQCTYCKQALFGVSKKHNNEWYHDICLHKLLDHATNDAAIAALREELERLKAITLPVEITDKDAHLKLALSRAEQARAALKALYTYPGVHDLLAPKDSLGSIAQWVEDILK